MKLLFIESITPETGKLVEFFQVTQVDRKAKKDGSAYLSLKLSDKTGIVAAKLWEIPEGFDAKPGNVVKVDAEASAYRNELQLTVRKIRLAEPAEWDKSDFIPASKQDRGVLYTDLVALSMEIGYTHLGLRDAVYDMIGEQYVKLIDCPAAKKLHQAYLGGLMEHILNIGQAAIKLCECYPQLDKDILIAAAVIHDIGKLQELEWDTHIGYAPIGSLVGHVTLGNMMWEKYSAGLDSATRLHLMHIIASHHGQLAWRAAVVPMTKEAFAFHMLDMLDARLFVIEAAVAAGVDENGFTPFIPAMESSVWNGK